VSIDTTGAVRPFDDFKEAYDVWPRGDRLEAIRDAARSFKRRFREQKQILGVRTYELIAAPYPTKLAFAGATMSLTPYVSLMPRVAVIQFEDFDGDRRTLVWQPTIPDGSREAPFYAQLSERYPQWMEPFFAPVSHELGEALALAGVRPEDVDYVTFDHLHVQDMRRLLGTTQPVDGRTEPWPPYFPNAKWILQRRELDTFRGPHPMQWAWYVPGGMDHAIEDQIVDIDGDVELGEGVALMWTPGHTDGNQTLVLNTPDGVWVSSENGVAIDNWQPELSKIPGIRRYAEFYNREVVLNSNTLEDSIDQYDSMVKERTVADASRRDPRFLNIFPSSEMGRLKRHWPVVPTFPQGELRYGEIVAPQSSNGG
jgi:hypothetical protein